MGSGGVRRRRWIARNHVFGAPGLFGTAGFAGFRRIHPVPAFDRRPTPAGLPTERKKDLLIVFTPSPMTPPTFDFVNFYARRLGPG